MMLSSLPITSRRRTGGAFNWWLSAPGWAEARVSNSSTLYETLRLWTGHEMVITYREAREWSLLTAQVDLNGGSGRAEIDRVASDMYREVTSRVATGGDRVRSPVRFWNFIPDIHAPERDGLDLYRAFNIGRHAAMMDWYGSEEAFAQLLPTATGVGHDGCELVVHCLSSVGAQMGVENPRQQPAYCYSQRFGPVPPSFARATVVQMSDCGRKLFVGGTSSVLGEESVHVGDVVAQLEETLTNLRALISHAFDVATLNLSPIGADPLTRLECLRVYYVRPSDLTALAQHLGEVLVDTDHIEYVRADICRVELLVEIEGVVPLDRPHASGVKAIG